MAILIDFGSLSLGCLTYVQLVFHLSVITFLLSIIYNVTMHINFSLESGQKCVGIHYTEPCN
jgi:hypothetical protein